MASNKNLIQSLRSAHDPHFKLEGRVGQLEKGLGKDVAQLHKTMSKSFGMQRKTLTRVLGLENRLSNLETAVEIYTLREGLRRQKEAEEVEEIRDTQETIEETLDETIEDVDDIKGDEEIPEGLDDTLNDIRGEGEPRGTAILDGEGISDGPGGGSRGTSTLGPDPTKKKKKPKAKKKPKIRAKKRKIKAEDIRKGTPTSTLDGEKKKIKADDIKKGIKDVNEKKIKADDIKKGTALDDDFNSRVLGEDADGEYLSKEERKARFKGEKFDPASVKPEDGADGSDGESGQDGKAENVIRGMGQSISTIADTVDSIFNTLKDQFDEKKDTKEDARIAKEQKDAEKAEKGLEKGGLQKGMEKQAKKALAPFTSIWDRFVNFLTTVLFGKIAMRIMDWFGNPGNADRVKSFVRFLRDWWPVLLASIMWFLPVLLGPAGMILGTVVLVAWALPKIMDVVKWLGDLPGKIVGFLMGGEKDLDKAEKEAGKDLEKETGSLEAPDATTKDEGRPKDLDNVQEQKDPKPKKFNKGGEVPGSGNKDTVPAMLTPGEFVMTKDAVQKYGVDTLEGLNAAAGGTNKPTLMSGFEEGGVVTDPEERKGQEAYMLKYVNEERALQGLEPLTDLTYAPGVELTKAVGPGPRTKETSDTNVDFDKGIKTTTTSKTVDGETTLSGSIGKTTEEDKQKFFAENPHAQALLNIKDQAELDGLGASISSKAKMNGGGLVQAFQGGGQVRQMNRMGMASGGLVPVVQKLNGGGVIRGFNEGGEVKGTKKRGGFGSMFNALPQVKAAKWLGGKMGGAFNMLPQVKAAKWLGNKAKGVFNKGKEFVGNALDKSGLLPPSKQKKVRVVTLPAKGSKGANALMGSSDIPDFNVVHPNGKSAKQKTLGITA